MKIYVFIFFCFLTSQNFSQVFWTETFNNGCTSNCLANGVNTGNGPWSVVSLAGDANPLAGNYPNQWYVSCAENGHTNTVCGSGCVAPSAVNTLASLHIGSTSLGDIGAAYDAGGACGFLYCTNTHKQVQSPMISTVGQTGITIAFDYIEFGQGTLDDMYALQYSTNGGATWVTLANPAKTTCCGGACNGARQGKWTTYTSVTLPSAADNNPNFKIAFVWINNDDGLGNDPSVAIDDITLSTAVILPIELIDFSYSSDERSTYLTWKTASEKNSSYFEVQRSLDGSSFVSLDKIEASGNSAELKKYSFTDELQHTLVYYRLKMTDTDGNFQYSKLLAVDAGHQFSGKPEPFVNGNGQLEINKSYVLANNFESASLFNDEGKQVSAFALHEFTNDLNIRIPVQNLQPGIYLCRMQGANVQKSFKFFIFR